MSTAILPQFEFHIKLHYPQTSNLKLSSEKQYYELQKAVYQDVQQNYITTIYKNQVKIHIGSAFTVNLLLPFSFGCA